MSASEVMSYITFLDKYSRYDWEKGRRESWEETVKRATDFLAETGNLTSEEYDLIYNAILNKKVSPAMRLLSTAGTAAKLNNASIYNCSYLPLESSQDFHDLTLLLGLGVGVGFSVEKCFVNLLGMVNLPSGRVYQFTIQDNIYSWAESIKFLIEHYLDGNRVVFDYSDRKSVV